MSKKKKTKVVSYVKVRNKQYDKLISIGTAILIALTLILFMVCPVVKTDVQGFEARSFTGYQLMFGYGNFIKPSWYALLIGIFLFVCLVLNIIGIFKKKYCLISGIALVLVGLGFIFVKSVIIKGDAYTSLLGLEFKNMPLMYICLSFNFIAALGEIYITSDENF